MKVCYLLLAFINMTYMLTANMSPEGFERFSNNYYFVATGIFGGNAIRLALRAGFSIIHAIDSDTKVTTIARSELRKHKNTYIWNADPAIFLSYIIRSINKPITFWLDSCRGAIASQKNSSILEELEQIQMHPIKNHTILIDDMHVVGTLYFDYITRDEIIKKILTINPDYTIKYIDGGEKGEYKNNIMVATTKK